MRPQRVPVYPATESDKVGKRRKATYEQSGAPMRCQIWDHRRLIGVVPITFDDMGHPSDVVFTPKELEKFTRLAFIYGGKVFAYPVGDPPCLRPVHPPGETCGRETVISPGKPLHLVLGHLNLLSRFGESVLKAGS